LKARPSSSSPSFSSEEDQGMGGEMREKIRRIIMMIMLMIVGVRILATLILSC
jgi:hypothetical protein